MAPDLFSAPIFIVVFRETLETGIIVSVLLAFLKQTLHGQDQHQDTKIYNALRKQVWLGVSIGFSLCVSISAAIIGIFYGLGRDVWANNEYYYEAAFSLLAAIIITLMGATLLRVGRLQEKWRAKLAKALEEPAASAKTHRLWLKRILKKYAMFVLPFITILREGIEAIVFVAGVSFSAPVTAIPLAVVAGLVTGGAVSYIIYRGASVARIQIFLVASTCFLYLVAAGLVSRAVWYIETQDWNKVVGGDAAELGSGPGSYDIDRSVWHVNCCSPQLNGGGGWGIFNALLGWTNSATYGSVISYNVYWILVSAAFIVIRFKETHGRYPFMKAAKHEETPETEPLINRQTQAGASS